MALSWRLVGLVAAGDSLPQAFEVEVVAVEFVVALSFATAVEHHVEGLD